MSYYACRENIISQSPSLKEIFINRKKSIISELSSELKLVEDLLQESFCLDKYIASQLLIVVTKEGPLDSLKALPPLYYTRNCHYLWASYELMLKALNCPCLSVLRTILETIYRIYFIQLADSDATELLYKIELEQTLSKIEKENKQKLFKNFKPWYIRDWLYNKDTVKKQNKLYGLLSTYSHPSIKSSGCDYEYMKSVTVDKMKMIEALALSNIVAIWEVYSDTFFIESNKDLEHLTDKYRKRMGFTPLLVPDSDNIINKVKVRVEDLSETP